MGCLTMDKEYANPENVLNQNNQPEIMQCSDNLSSEQMNSHQGGPYHDDQNIETSPLIPPSSLPPIESFKKFNDPSYASWLIARLVQLKNDTITFRTTFDNIVNLGFDTKELEKILEIPNLPGSIQNLATDQYVKLTSEIKTKFGAIHHFIEKNNCLPPTSFDYNNKHEDNKLSMRPVIIHQERQVYPPRLPSIEDPSFSRKIKIPKYNLPESEVLFIDKLEYLGEQIITETIDSITFLQKEEYQDTDLLKIRTIILDQENLSKWAYLCNFHYDLDLNRNFNENKILSDFFKIYTGALFYDSGYNKDKIIPWLTRYIEYRIEEIERTGELNQIADPIRVKQELTTGGCFSSNFTSSSTGQYVRATQKPFKVKPGYISSNASSGELNSKVYPTFAVEYPTLEKAGSDNAPVFTVGCVIHGEILGIGSFSNLKNAKQLAAKDALENNIEKVKKYIGWNDAKRSKQIQDIPPPMDTPLATQIPLMYAAFESTVNN